MSFSFLSAARSVFLISDDAAYIYNLSGKDTKCVGFVEWDDEAFSSKVTQILNRECGKAPVLFVNDMVEQHYRKERVPRVSPLDKANLINRKLGVAFPSYPVRAALPLKEKIAATDKKLAADIYIFAAIPSSEQFEKSVTAVNDALSSVAGFTLLPVESASMVKTLSNKLQKSASKETATWCVFMGQHKGGGLRQIVTRDGELALTRMTPIIDSDEDPERWTKEVMQEFSSTMSYVSRFGYTASDGLHVITIADEKTEDLLYEKMDVECEFSVLTVSDAARLLKIPLRDVENERHAAPLHIGWIGRKRSFVLPMKSSQLETISRPRQIATIAIFLLFLGVAFQAYQFFDSYGVLAEFKGDLDGQRTRQLALENQLQEEIKKKEALGFDVIIVQTSLAVNKGFNDKDVNGLRLFQALGESLGTDLRLDRVSVEKVKDDITQQRNNNFGFVQQQDQEENIYKARVQMTFPTSIDVEEGNRQVREFRERLSQRLPDHVVEVEKFLKDYRYIDELVIGGEQTNTSRTEQDYIVSISIRKPAV